MSAPHLDQERLQRLLHRELDTASEVGSRAHLAQCAECRRKLQEAELEEEEVGALLLAVDNRPPQLDAERIAAIAAERRVGQPQLSVSSGTGAVRRPSERSRLWRRAAVLVAAVGLAGAAWALPGSPIRALVQRVAAKFSGASADSIAADRTTAVPDSNALTAGARLRPGSRLVIQFSDATVEARATVTLDDREDVEILIPPDRATLSSPADDSVVIAAASAASGPVLYLIRIPRTAPHVEIRSGARRVFLKLRDSVVTGAVLDSVGRYLLPLRAPGG